MVICGAQNWEDIEELGHCKEEFFREIQSLPNGIPSHDTFNRFFVCLSPEALEQQFRLWGQTLCREKCGTKFLCRFKTALAMLKEYPVKRSIATKRKSAGWSNKVLMDILTV